MFAVKYVVAGFSPRYARASMRHCANSERGLKPATTYADKDCSSVGEKCGLVRVAEVGQTPVHPFSQFGVRPKELIKQGSDPIENGAQAPDPELSSSATGC